MKLKVPFKFVEIEWADAHSTDAWVEESSLPEPAPIISRGWLVKDTKTYVVVAGTIAPAIGKEPMQLGEIIAIPKSWVKGKMRTLKV